MIDQSDAADPSQKLRFDVTTLRNLIRLFEATPTEAEMAAVDLPDEVKRAWLQGAKYPVDVLREILARSTPIPLPDEAVKEQAG